MKDLCILSAAALMGLAFSASNSQPAFALEGWSNGQPIFDSEVIRPRQDDDRAQYKRYYSRHPFPALMEGGPRPNIAPEAPPIVSLAKAEKPGQIIIDSGSRRLLYTLPGNKAYEYPISVGREGFAWTGSERISRIAAWPDWNPPAEMIQREPYLPKKMLGGIRNPLGAKALYLGNSLYRIHGTNDPKTIGRAASSGCFRMMNQHVIHLASLAGVGTPVRVVAKYRGAQTAAR